MNTETARALTGENTRNLAPYLADLPPALRRPDATGENPVGRAPGRPAHLATHARRGHGRHRRRTGPGAWEAFAAAVVVLLAVLVAWLVVRR